MKPTTKPKQIDKIKADLLNRRPVDNVAAFQRHHITRLSAIIKRLRDKGWPISTRQEKNNGLARYSVPADWRPPAMTGGHKKSRLTRHQPAFPIR